MLEIGGFRARDCDGISRRACVRAATCLPLLSGLPLFGATRRAAGADDDESAAGSPGAPLDRPPAQVILVWLWGGPSHLDTFDPKPNAPDAIRGPFQTIPTRTPGERFTELVPRLARRSDLFSVLRSTRFAANHDMVPLTGRRGRGELEPNFGSIVARERSVVGLPSFVSVSPRTKIGHGFKATSVPGYGAGRFGSAYDPFLVECGPEGRADIAVLRLLDGLTPERLADRRQLRDELDALTRRVDRAATQTWNRQLESAYSLLAAGGAGAAFDLSKESETARRAYGRTSFGQSLLLGRRLVEAGIPYVQVNWSLGVDGLQEGSNMGWDTHRNGFGQLLNYHCPVFDRAFSALLEDLQERGLLESTLVVAFGEMGRTPKINKTGGRDHWATCSTLWAGGGVVGGRVVGETDAQGAHPITEPYSAVDVGTTIAQLAGIGAQERAELGVLAGGRVIDGLL